MNVTLNCCQLDALGVHVDDPPVTPRYTYEPSTYPDNVYDVSGNTDTVCVHCASSEDDGEPANAPEPE